MSTKKTPVAIGRGAIIDPESHSRRPIAQSLDRDPQGTAGTVGRDQSLCERAGSNDAINGGSRAGLSGRVRRKYSPMGGGRLSNSVRYEKQLRERAKHQKLFLVTVSVDGKPIGDGSCTVQRTADLQLARRICKLAISLMRTQKVGACLLLCLLGIGCSSHKPARAPVPPPTPEIRVIHPQLEGCAIKNKIATCECLSASTRIDSKTGKSVVICKIAVKEVSR